MLASLESKRVKGVSWEDASLDTVVAHLRTVTGLNFSITPRVRAERMEEVSITFTGDDVSVRSLLDVVITEPYGLGWEVRNGAVTIGVEDELGDVLRTAYFDMQDLRVSIDGRPAPAEAAQGAPDPEEVVAAIRATVGPAGTWEEPASLDTRSGIIIARNRPEFLAQVQTLIAEAKARGSSFRRPAQSVRSPGR